jgi:hypothetical protein
LKNLFYKLKFKFSFFYSNLFFFRKEINFYDRFFFNKLVFFNYPSFWAGPALFALGRNFFLNDYLKLKLTAYSFFSFKRFNFFSPFGFVSFLNRVYEVAYHYKYKRDFPLFFSDTSGGFLSEEFKNSKDSFDFFDIVNTTKFNQKLVIIKKREAMIKAMHNKNRKSLTMFKLKSFFSRFFLRSLVFFRKKFFFSFFNKFRSKLTKIFSICFFKLEKAITFLKKVIFFKFFLFFYSFKNVFLFNFFFSKNFNKYYKHFFRFFFFSKFFFFKKEVKLLYRFISFRNSFRKMFFFNNKEHFLRFFYF